LSQHFNEEVIQIFLDSQTKKTEGHISTNKASAWEKISFSSFFSW